MLNGIIDDLFDRLKWSEKRQMMYNKQHTHTVVWKNCKNFGIWQKNAHKKFKWQLEKRT